MGNLTSEVQADGTTTITDASQPTTEFQFKQEQVGAQLPEVPTSEVLSKLFTPRYVLNVTAPDGTVIPFLYKRLDPGTLLLTHGAPVAVSVDVRDQAAKLKTEMETLGISDDDTELDAEQREKALELLQKEGTREMLEQAEKMRKHTLKTAVLAPVINDELYENLADEVKEALYDAITGGVTSDTELVETFPNGAETGAE